MSSTRFPFLVAISWLAFVTVLLCIPGTEFPKLTWLNKIWFDKWVHIGLFMLLVTAWCWVYAGKESLQNLKKTFLSIAVTGLVYGAAMELVQHYFIPFRSFDVGDIIADGIGCYAGYFISFRRYIKK